MKIVHGDEVAYETRKEMHRVGTFRFRRLLEGEVGSAGNYSLQMVHTIDDFFSPRHKHNFDQFRYQIDGEFDFDRNGLMRPGMVGYFPEGTPYGPQTSSVSSLTLVLQFGGASHSGYLSEQEHQAGTGELKKVGVFEKGVFRRNADVEGKRNMDGYQAVWEHVNGRPLVYPKARYHDPVMMEPANFDWAPVEGEAGVSDKMMGVFTERRTEARFLRLEAGARHRDTGRRIFFVLDGAGTAGGNPYRKWTTLMCEQGEAVELQATAPTEVLVLGLPRLDVAVPHAQAAE